MKVTKQELNQAIEIGIILRDSANKKVVPYWSYAEDQWMIRLINIAEHIRDGKPVEVIEK